MTTLGERITQLLTDGDYSAIKGMIKDIELSNFKSFDYSITFIGEVGVENVDDLFVFKETTQIENTFCDDINSLKDRISNFMYVFGETEYEGKRGLLLERVNGVCFGEWIEGRSLEEVGEVLAQIFLSLAVAQGEFGFIHGDLNPGNIMIEELNNPRTFNYNGRKIVSRYRAVIIDFDGCIKSYENGRPCAMLDAYCILSGLDDRFGIDRGCFNYVKVDKPYSEIFEIIAPWFKIITH